VTKQKNQTPTKGGFAMPNNSTVTFKIQVYNNPETYDDMFCKLTRQGERHARARHMRMETKPHTRKLNKTQYMLLFDGDAGCAGEIKEYQEKVETMRQKENLQRTFNHIKGIIRTNFESGTENQLFITLTYAENMKDPKRLYKDFENFIVKLRRYCKGHQLEYVTVAEPQARGAWHMHVMLKSDKPVLIVINKDIARLWGHGYTRTTRLKSDDVGRYYEAYFTDLIVNDDGTEATQKEIDAMPQEEKSKKKIKGERLKFYPPYFKFYRKSRGIMEPTEEYMLLKDIRTEYGTEKFARGYEQTKTDENEKEKSLNMVTLFDFKKGENDNE